MAVVTSNSASSRHRGLSLTLMIPTFVCYSLHYMTRMRHNEQETNFLMIRARASRNPDGWLPSRVRVFSYRTSSGTTIMQLCGVLLGRFLYRRVLTPFTMIVTIRTVVGMTYVRVWVVPVVARSLRYPCIVRQATSLVANLAVTWTASV